MVLAVVYIAVLMLLRFSLLFVMVIFWLVEVKSFWVHRYGSEQDYFGVWVLDLSGVSELGIGVVVIYLL